MPPLYIWPLACGSLMIIGVFFTLLISQVDRSAKEIVSQLKAMDWNTAKDEDQQ